MMGNVVPTTKRARQQARSLKHIRGNSRLAAQAGYTLVEMLVVLMIMALIMSLIGPRVLNYLSDSKHKTARIQIEALSSAAELFFFDNGRYPLDAEGLQVLVTRPSNLTTWSGPYLKSDAVPLDPWGKPYRYVSTDRGRSYVISYVGPDGRASVDEQKRLTPSGR